MPNWDPIFAFVIPSDIAVLTLGALYTQKLP